MGKRDNESWISFSMNLKLSSVIQISRSDKIIDLISLVRPLIVPQK